MKHKLLNKLLTLTLLILGGAFLSPAWGQTEATFDWTSGGNMGSNATGTVGQITLTGAQNSASGAPAVTSNTLRLYAHRSSGDGASATFTAASNYVITKIEVTSSNGGTILKYATNSANNFSEFSFSSGKATVSDLNVSSITLKNCQSSGKSNTTIQISKVVITYESTGGSSTTATTTTIDATGITNTDIYTSTEAGSLAATVKVKDGDPIDGATVTWSGNNDDVATIDENGVVTLVGIGKVTFTASYAGVQDQYSSSSAQYTLTVVPVYASLDDLVADENVQSNDIVKVTFENVEIKSFYKTSGIYFDIQKGGKDIEIYYSAEAIPSEWVVGGTLSGTIQCPWYYYSNGSTWELTPASGTWSWDNLSYQAPAGAKTTATIEFTAKSKLEVNAVDEYDVTYNGDGTLEVESSNTGVATVAIENGHVVVTAVAVGTATITVSAPETDEYTEASKQYTLTVSQAFDRNVHKALVAEKNGKYYAAYNTTSNSYFTVKEVAVYKDKVYELSDADAAEIAWQVDVDGTVATVRNLNSEYLALSTSTAVSLSSDVVELYASENGGFYYASDGRGFGYNYNNGNARMASYNISTTYPVAKAMEFAGENEPLPANMRITSAGWGTFCAPFTVAIPDGVKAYWGENMISYIKLNEVEGYIPANTGVVVAKAVEGDPFEVYLSPNAVEYDTYPSCFACNTAEEKMNVAQNDYLLQKQNNVVGWYQVKGDGFTLAKYRCYLPGNTNEGREFVGFEPVDDPTGISSIVSEIKTKADGKYMVKGQIIVVKSGKAYNLNGAEIK